MGPIPVFQKKKNKLRNRPEMYVHEIKKATIIIFFFLITRYPLLHGSEYVELLDLDQNMLQAENAKRPR